ncbi:uncharacterized protein CELE_C10A4.10 [Caenorhabditis elegans]|uniref:Uncharacterized protein n=1 Tax=Caenorhabditis elegans TaxID=6239 RepID=A8WFH1_CAEEL|nr:Uncharacterized protein CELE_C10A4.10 [Caenorhabditis elegans]CCD62400.1 Uncharacterized protein CELE_C10A4.10 [Caenorhabditis elegans]|eukprot:NP_001123101.1 Uncharacterized protein CELE_C10A4.10 [Caenorhabditis elegans]
MFNVKIVTQLILFSTIFSVVILLSIKYFEIQTNYPRKYFCVTCPCLPDPSLPRNIEIELNFNLLILADFFSMMMIILQFGMERYHEHPTYLFSLHVCRFVFNITNFTTSGAIGKVLKPIFNELCGLGGKCSDENVLPHTIVGLLYLIYISIMMTNFAVSIILMYFYDPYYQLERPPVIMRLNGTNRRSRSTIQPQILPSLGTSPHSSFNRSPSPPKFTRVVIPTTKRPKYNKLDSNESIIFKYSKNKIMPVNHPNFQSEIVIEEY